MKLKPKALLITLTIAIIITLSGCVPILSTDMSLNIGLQEKWIFDIVIVPEAGVDSQAVVDVLNSRFLNNGDVKSNGVTVSVEVQNQLPDGNVPIKMSMQGKGYDVLNQALSENIITIDGSSGQKLLHFNMSSNQGMTVQSTTFTLSGGKILDHNGELTDDHTVVWRNYNGEMQATMAEPSYVDYWLYIGIAAVLFMIVVFIILLIVGLAKSSKSKKAKITQAPRIKTCTQCGSSIPAVAVFCPNCGSQQN